MHALTMSDPPMEGVLVEACRRGDREALRALFDAYKDRVFSLAAHLTGDEATAKDITQDVFLTLATRIGRFRGEARFATWLYRLVVNACMDEHRRRRRLVPAAGIDDPGRTAPGNPVEEDLAMRQVRAAVRVAVAQLSPRLRLPILLRYLGDLSYEEIAAALGCTKGTVASRLNRGHRALARRLASLRR